MQPSANTLPDRPTLWSPLAHRDFALLWGGYVFSHVGDSVQVHAQAWLVTDLTHSGLRVGAVALAQSLPRLILGLFAGVLVDRVDRRKLLMVTQALAMAQSVTFYALLATHQITYERVVILAAALGVFDTLNLNARIAMMPSLVPRALLGKAIALQALGVNIVQIAGPAITGILIAAVGVKGCVLVNACTFIVLLAALVAMRPPRGVVSAGAAASRGIAAGFHFVLGKPLLWASILLAYLLGFFGVSFVRLLALYARLAIGASGAGYGVLAASVGVGAIIASLALTARASSEHLPRNMVLASGAFCASLFVLAVARTYPVGFLALAMLGFGQMGFRSAVTTSIQLETPDAMRGRVNSLLTLDFSLWSLGAIVAGALSDRLANWHAAGGSPLPMDQRFGLSTAAATMGAACTLAVLALSRTLLRSRLSPATEVGDDVPVKGT